MRARKVSCAAAVAFLATVCGALAQQPQIEWKQTYNMPKGTNLPKNVKADILGIELGDSFVEARRKLIALLAETDPEEAKKLSPTETIEQIVTRLSNLAKQPPLEDQKMTFASPTQTQIQASYIGRIILRREMKGTGKRPIDEILIVYFSGPPSGQQVTGMERTVSFPEITDHPLISEMIIALQRKFQTEGRQEGYRYLIQFNDGDGIVTNQPLPIACSAQSGYRAAGKADIPNINKRGDCDIVLHVEFRPGMSTKHASSIFYTLEDNERTKANLIADYAFFDDYVRKVQSGKGAAPKL